MELSLDLRIASAVQAGFEAAASTWLPLSLTINVPGVANPCTRRDKFAKISVCGSLTRAPVITVQRGSTMRMTESRILQAALGTVADACRVARQVQRDIEKVRRIAKDDKSPVTVADFAVQAVVAMGLHERLGQSLIAGEETTGQLRTAEQAPVLQAVIEEVAEYQPASTPRTC